MNFVHKFPLLSCQAQIKRRYNHIIAINMIDLPMPASEFYLFGFIIGRRKKGGRRTRRKHGKQWQVVTKNERIFDVNLGRNCHGIFYLKMKF